MDSYIDNFKIDKDTLPLIAGVMERIPGGFFMYYADGDQELIYFNRHMLTLYGCETEDEFRELTGNSFKGIVHPDDYHLTEADIKNQIESGDDNIDHVIYRYIRKDGSVGVLDDYGHFSHSESYGDIYYVFAQDITKQHEEEVERQERLTRLMMLEDKFESFYDVDMVTGDYEVYIKDETIMRAVNEMLGEQREFFSDTKKNTELVVHPEDRKAFFEVVSRDYILENLEKKDSIDFYYRLILGGKFAWYRLRIFYKDENRRNVLIGIFNAEEEIAAKEKAEQKRREQIAKMAGGISAYIVNPETERFRIISQTTHFAENYPADEDYYTSIHRYIESDVYPDDREMLSGAVEIPALLEHLESGDGYSIRYRDWSSGDIRWYEMKSVKLSDTEILIGFTDVDEEVIGRLVADNVQEEYTALYYVNLDTDDYVSRHLIRKTEDIRPYYEKFPKYTDLAHAFARSELVHPEDRDSLLSFYPSAEGIRSVLRNRNRISMLFRRNYDGEYLWTEVKIIKCEGEGEEAHNAVIGFTERDRATRERAEYFNRIDEANRLIETTAAKYSVAVRVNLETAGFRILRFDEELTGKVEPFENYFGARESLMKIIHPADADFMKRELDFDTIRNKLGSERGYSVEYRTLINNVTKWHEMIVVSLGNEEVAMGFTEKSEEILRRRIEEKRFGEYLALFVVDLDTGMIMPAKTTDIFTTASVGEALPYESEMRKFASAYDGEARDYLELISNIDYLKTALATEDKRSFTFKAARMGEDKWIDVTGYVILRHEDGTPAMFALGFSLEDTMATAREEFQEQLQKQQVLLEEARRAAEAANRSKTSFLFNLSHDIRTPMNAIQGFTNMASKYVGDAAKIKDYLHKIDTSGQQLLSLINQVLEMARIDSGKVELEDNHIDIREEFETMITVLSEQAMENGLDFHHSLNDVRHYYLLADKARMNSVTLNITGNAMKYTPRGGAIDVRLSEIPARKDGYASFVFTVIDNGIGMSEEYQKVLFEPFTREKNSTVSKIQGTGLGMSIVKELVDLMGGTIEVESELGKGTRFDITIDFRIDKAGKVISEEAQKESGISLEGRRVLLVEDNELNREIAVEILEDGALEVEEAEDGTVAVDLLREKGPDYYDFILMDIQMPVMDGYEATRAIREMYPESEIPIIALSANAFAEDMAASLLAGMDAHVAKPIDVKKLFGTMESLL